MAINKNKAREGHASRRRRVQPGNEWEETNGSRVKGDGRRERARDRQREREKAARRGGEMDKRLTGPPLSAL